MKFAQLDSTIRIMENVQNIFNFQLPKLPNIFIKEFLKYHLFGIGELKFWSFF